MRILALNANDGIALNGAHEQRAVKELLMVKLAFDDMLAKIKVNVVEGCLFQLRHIMRKYCLTFTVWLNTFVANNVPTRLCYHTASSTFSTTNSM